MKNINITEFSKRFIVDIVRVYIGGAIFGAALITAQLAASIVTKGAVTVDLSSYLTFLAVPLSCGIMSYMGKAAFENREKIKKLTREDVVGMNNASNGDNSAQ